MEPSQSPNSIPACRPEPDAEEEGEDSEEEEVRGEEHHTTTEDRSPNPSEISEVGESSIRTPARNNSELVSSLPVVSSPRPDQDISSLHEDSNIDLFEDQEHHSKIN